MSWGYTAGGGGEKNPNRSWCPTRTRLPEGLGHHLATGEEERLEEDWAIREASQPDGWCSIFKKNQYAHNDRKGEN
jgi:hypothetical protein